MGIKLDLEPQELDVVTQHLQHGQWGVVNNTLVKIMQQANDPARNPPPDKSVGEKMAEIRRKE